LKGGQVVAHNLVQLLRDRNLTVVTAESCTGGLLAGAITDVSGASDVFHYGYIAYGPEAKILLLNIDPQTIEKYGVVSKECAISMAIEALKATGASFAVSTTGVAGPTGGDQVNPVGTVHIGIADREKEEVFTHHFEGDRQSVRSQAVEQAIHHLEKWVKK
jgi:PncC family amidohydrolase